VEPAGQLGRQGGIHSNADLGSSMMSQNDRPALSLARWFGTTSLVLILVAGCVTAGSAASPIGPAGTPAPSASAPSGSPSPTGGISTSGFYMRAWQTQALAPQNTFTWLPLATISGGQYIDGMVAVPAIYPGPLWIGPSVQTISAKGIAAIVAEARSDGLLGQKTDFTGTPMAGAMTAHIELIVDGTRYDLTGDAAAATTAQTPAPGSSAAFAALWQKLTGLDAWLSAELGQSSEFEPQSLAVLALPPAVDTSGLTPSQVTWPLATPFSAFGTAMGSVANRCAVVSGTDLAKLETVVKQANQLTRFVDGAGVKDTLLVRVMVPGEPSPCQ
jgi:hypothetical protein